MKSVFDPASQHWDVDSKIVAALERLAEAIRVLLWTENRETRLSPIQMQFLVHCFFQPRERRTISQLAEFFNLTPATVSDAVRVLETKGFLTRESDPDDRRVAYLNLTPSGEAIADRVSLWAEPMRRSLEGIDASKKLATMETLMEMIAKLYEWRVISVAQMCIVCGNFHENPSSDETAPYYCALREQPIEANQLRLSCPGHRLLRGTAR
jgi:DNA-binding MarR family transcriptional regulator